MCRQRTKTTLHTANHPNRQSASGLDAGTPRPARRPALPHQPRQKPQPRRRRAARGQIRPHRSAALPDAAGQERLTAHAAPHLCYLPCGIGMRHDDRSGQSARASQVFSPAEGRARTRRLGPDQLLLPQPPFGLQRCLTCLTHGYGPPPGLSPDPLQITAATTLLLAGVPVHVVAARLGHADPSVTLRVYAHVLNEQMVSVAEVFARAVGEDAVSNPVSKLGPRRPRPTARKDKSPGEGQRARRDSNPQPSDP
jgi:hypothetical protein